MLELCPLPFALCPTCLCLVLAPAALKGVGAEVSNSNETAQIANMNSVGIRGLKQSFVEELCGSVGYLTVTLHLTKTQATIPAGSKTERERESRVIKHTHTHAHKVQQCYSQQLRD